MPGISIHGIQGAHSEGYVADVLVIDLNCEEENQTCVSRPSHLIEYYGADWWKECPAVEDQLRNVTDDSSIILSHRPSSSDFWQASKTGSKYTVLGYPTLALDGHYIFAGQLNLEN